MLCIHQELSDNPSGCSASSSPYTGEPLNGAARRMSAAAPEPPLCEGRWAAGPGEMDQNRFPRFYFFALYDSPFVSGPIFFQ